MRAAIVPTVAFAPVQQLSYAKRVLQVTNGLPKYGNARSANLGELIAE